MKFKHIKSKKNNSISLIVVPNSNTKNIRQMKLPTWIPKLIFLLIIIFLSSTVYLFQSYKTLKSKYTVNVDKLKVLKQKNERQKAEIETLKQKTAEIEDKLKTISELQETVRDMVGLKESKLEKEKDSNSISSRNGAALLNTTSLHPDLISIEQQMDTLSKLLDEGQEELSGLIVDVEKRLKYLEAKPNYKPAPGRISSGFGYRINPFGRNREFHTGIDIANNYGTKIVAAGSGVVTFSGYNGGMGYVVVISHGYGYQSIYGHNKKLLVEVGDKVEKGETIALMGSTGRSTGPHVHFEIRYYGKPVDPEDIINNYD
ncbi:M23 family metallopeptidase [Caldisalinibacter kiritimatiensis]|uniref:Peptidase, M23/M37 family n=1 Tax=Caldisalinibacter kiritimatiensis TaxID=1304284 RepID=R1CH90_9FIRM|nr:M23 family metallopeptidase [Caldisalinibacter kiritimatiensis]EOD01660.1 Peptidase, M23/M37 family [Caldisalinibacter kiritimatiensis]